jgi:N-acetyl-1-D-myo-inositol-2-amino-2-deoxy-alpha-D-glucopyranoside deacetylase
MPKPNGSVDHHGNPLRLVLVHAHPDDETTTTGATIARYAADGVDVTLVTCTRGERGEVLDPGIDTASAVDPAEALGEHRVGELAAATAALGLTDVRFLGGPGTWWDSGMAGTESTADPRALSNGDLATQARQLAAVLREVRPQVVITYDERGGYGHPDHIRAHEIAVAAIDVAAGRSVAASAAPVWVTSKLYAAVVPVSVMAQAMTAIASTAVDGPNPFAAFAPANGAGGSGDPAGPAGGPPAGSDGGPDATLPDDLLAMLPFAVPDAAVTTRIDGRGWLGAKGAAMRAHRSQMHANGWFFVLVDEPGQGFGVEHYQLLRGTAAPPAAGELETDLFAGIRAESNLEVALNVPNG